MALWVFYKSLQCSTYQPQGTQMIMLAPDGFWEYLPGFGDFSTNTITSKNTKLCSFSAYIQRPCLDKEGWVCTFLVLGFKMLGAVWFHESWTGNLSPVL